MGVTLSRGKLMLVVACKRNVACLLECTLLLYTMRMFLP